MTEKRRWYSFCANLQRLDQAGQEKVFQSKKMRFAAARIARLHREVGTALDDAGAPLRCLIFVAYAPDEVVVRTNQVQQTRFDAVMGFHREHRKWPLPWQISILRINVWERLHGRKADPRPEPEEPEETATAQSVESSQDGSEAAPLALALALTGAKGLGLDPSHVPALRDAILTFARERQST